MAETETFLRIVVFGRRGAGKSEFVAAASRAVPQAVFVDTDSEADERAMTAGEVPAELLEADALAVTVDAAADAAEVAGAAMSVRWYLDTVMAKRMGERAVDAWPVTVLMTKCDRLLTLGDTRPEWLARIDHRLAAVKETFAKAFPENEDSRFGGIDVDVLPTATRTPAIAGAPVDSTGGFGITAAATHLANAARLHRSRSQTSNRRLTLLATASSVLLAVLAVAGILAEFTPQREPDDQLANRVRSYQIRERSTAIRLSDARRPRTRAELISIRDEAGFAALPNDLREYVTERIAELDRYDEFAKRFRRPPPAECRSHDELNRLVAELKTTLAPQPEDAANWAETEAVRLREKWATDIDAIRTAEARLHDWYRGLARRANDLSFTTLPDRTWRAEVEAAIRDADEPPFRANDNIPGSVEIPVLGGQKLTYATAIEFDRIDAARRDWEQARDRITRLRDLAEAAGMTGDTGKIAGLLDWSDAPDQKAAFAAYAADRVARLRQWFPALVEEPHLFAAAGWPDANREEFRRKLTRSRDAFVTRMREMIRTAVLAAGMGQETLAAWRTVSRTMPQEPAFVDGDRLLILVCRILDEKPNDPVADLRAMVSAESFSLKVDALEISIPDDLRPQRLEPGNVMRVTFGNRIEEFQRTGTATASRGFRSYRFVADPNGRPPLSAGDVLTAKLEGTIGTGTVVLEWSHGRSAVFPFDRFQFEPTLIEPSSRKERAVGVTVRIVPEGGWPVLPVLVPDFSAGR